MRIDFFFERLKPFSANKSVSFNKKGKYFKNKDKDNFQKYIDAIMIRHKPSIFEFTKYFSRFEHLLVGTLYVFMPRDVLFTKSNTISKTGGDVNNNKNFTDRIFHHLPELDDSQLISEPPFKLISPDGYYHMGYKLEIFDLDTLDKWSENAWNEISL
jgi:hypothetical protein